MTEQNSPLDIVRQERQRLEQHIRDLEAVVTSSRNVIASMGTRLLKMEAERDSLRVQLDAAREWQPAEPGIYTLSDEYWRFMLIYEDGSVSFIPSLKAGPDDEMNVQLCADLRVYCTQPAANGAA